MYEFIDKLMQERGVTLYKLSKDTGIPYSTLATCKKKGTKLGLDKVQAIADYFGVTVDYLMGKQGNGYYINDETAKMAQTLLERSDLKILFDLAEDATPQDVETAVSVLMALKEKESK